MSTGKMYHPELVVQDAKHKFHLTEEQAEDMRDILRTRGVNKALLQRRLWIDVKHAVKARMVMAKHQGFKELAKELQFLNMHMQTVAKLPREVRWDTRADRSAKRSTSSVRVQGVSLDRWLRERLKHCSTRWWQTVRLGRRMQREPYAIWEERAVQGCIDQCPPAGWQSAPSSLRMTAGGS